MTDLTSLKSHFRFGENWQDYARGIDRTKIAEAQADLERLVGKGSLDGRSFADVGCGSGIHSLAALNLGAKKLLAVDLDPESVSATKATLSAYAPNADWDCRELSIFEANPREIGEFDVVYSWGVLHHTGSMWSAVERAAGLVAPGGIFVLAIYLKTPFCGFWRWEKQLYSRSGPLLQFVIRNIYSSLLLLRVMMSGRSPISHVRSYGKRRGMSFRHDVQDWLGGYPYESASSAEIENFLNRLDFRRRCSFHTDPNIGLFGSGCAEYVFVRAGSGVPPVSCAPVHAS